MKPLAIIPTYIRTPSDIALVTKCIATLKKTAGDKVDIVVVDDGSPSTGYINLHSLALPSKLDFTLIRKTENTGFASTVNKGLQIALDEGRDAILVNADIEFKFVNWLEPLQESEHYVTGAQLLFPNGLSQHAGIYYSVLNRFFDHRYRLAPGNLPAAQKPCVCPVTGALQYIKYESLVLLGIYDEGFKMGWEDVDYCLRVFKAGRSCYYEPRSRAIHHEGVFRTQAMTNKIQKWTEESHNYLLQKHAGLDFSSFVPTMLERP